MREHKSAIEKQMAEKNEHSKRDIVCEVKMVAVIVVAHVCGVKAIENRVVKMWTSEETSSGTLVLLFLVHFKITSIPGLKLCGT